MIEFADCSLSYVQGKSSLQVYDKFSLKIARGESVVLIGPVQDAARARFCIFWRAVKTNEGKVIIEGQAIVKPPVPSDRVILQDLRPVSMVECDR
jgi:NitT/TauT family transport system ATP-binding protein